MRRKTLAVFLAAILVCACQTPSPKERAQHQDVINIGLLHLELKYADLEHNAKLVERGIRLAAQQGADWVVTPELSVTGYRFDLKLGTDWISHGPDQYVKRVQALARQYHVSVFFSHLEGTAFDETPKTEQTIFNTLFVINSSGAITGRHRKINTIPISESWSTPGENATVVEIDGYKVGLLICADAWPESHTRAQASKGAELIISSANWAPGEYGPGDTWEKRSLESKLALFVANRTGVERGFDLTKSESVVSFKGERLLSHQSDESAVVLVGWDTTENAVLEKRTLAIGSTEIRWP